MFKVWKMPVVFGGGDCDVARVKLRIFVTVVGLWTFDLQMATFGNSRPSNCIFGR